MSGGRLRPWRYCIRVTCCDKPKRCSRATRETANSVDLSIRENTVAQFGCVLATAQTDNAGLKEPGAFRLVPMAQSALSANSTSPGNRRLIFRDCGRIRDDAASPVSIETRTRTQSARAANRTSVVSRRLIQSALSANRISAGNRRLIFSAPNRINAAATSTVSKEIASAGKPAAVLVNVRGAPLAPLLRLLVPMAGLEPNRPAMSEKSRVGGRRLTFSNLTGIRIDRECREVRLRAQTTTPGSLSPALFVWCRWPDSNPIGPRCQQNLRGESPIDLQCQSQDLRQCIAAGKPAAVLVNVRGAPLAPLLRLLVPMAGLEPAQLSLLPPQDSVSTNSTTSA